MPTRRNRAKFLPLNQVRPHAGLCYTIFAGDQVEKFDLEVPASSTIFSPEAIYHPRQLKGPKVEHTGVAPP